MREIREKLGLSRWGLSHLVGCSVGTIEKIENDKVVPKIVTAGKIAKRLGCTIDYLEFGK